MALRRNRPVVVDTDIAIDHLRGVLSTKEFLEDLRRRRIKVMYSAITETELHAGARTARNADAVMQLLSQWRRVPVDGTVARKAGDYYREFRPVGLSMPDAIIAATAFHKHATLVTRNRRHYEKIEELEIDSP